MDTMKANNKMWCLNTKNDSFYIYFLYFIVMLVAIAPISGATKDFLTIGGVRFYEILLLISVYIAPVVFFDRKLAKIFLIVSLILGLVTVHSLILGQSLYNTIYSQREIYWYFIGVIVGIYIYKKINANNLEKIFWVLFAIYLFYSLLAANLFRDLFISFQDDILVGESDEHLRISFESLILIVWVATYLFNVKIQEKKYFYSFILVLSTYVAVFLSSSRTMIAVMIVCFCYVIMKRYLLIGVICLVIVTSATLTMLQFMPDSDRYTVDYQVYSWVARNSPFVEKISSFNARDYLIGRGIGETFYIPWFKEAGLNQEGRNIDGMYQTLLVKIGFIGVFIFVFCHFYLIMKLSKIKTLLSQSLIAAIYSQIFLALTVSYLYRISSVFYGVIIGIAITTTISKNCGETETRQHIKQILV